MKKIIELPKETLIKEKEIIYKPLVKFYNSEKLFIRSLIRDNELLRIDFVHFADPKYINGGWVRIEPGTFVRPVGTSLRLEMVKAEGVPIAPNKHYYKSKQDKLFYSLYFPSIGDEIELIDIIEKEGGDDTYFNFYGVAVSKILSSPIIVSNIKLPNSIDN